MHIIEKFLLEKLNAKSVLVIDIGTLTTIIYTSTVRIKFIVLARAALEKPEIRGSADIKLVIILVAYVIKRQI